jgi:hypothetical protein
MKILKYLIISLITIIILTFIYGKLFFSKTVMIAGEEVSVEKPWRKPTENESETFKRLITSFNFAECTNLYLKEVDNENFILACLKEDKKWDFYWATPKRNDLMRLSKEVKAEITPPK